MSNHLNKTKFYTKLLTLPDGANDVYYQGKRYLLRKETLLDTKLIKIYAQELGGNDIAGSHQQNGNERIPSPPLPKITIQIIETCF